MPPRRPFETKISGHASKKAHLTPSQRQSIIAKHEAGVSLTELAAEFRRSKSTIHDTLKRYKLHATTSDLPRSGRPPILSLRQKNIIYREARATPKIEYSNLIKEATFVNAEGLPLKPPSRSTLCRTLKRWSRTNRRCKKRPKLNQGRALKRLHFSRQHRKFEWHRRTVKFSEECSVQKGFGSEQEWAFRFPWEKWKPEMISPSGTS